MARELLTSNIFLDTSIFESENFLEGKKIRNLFELANKGEVQIFLSKITYQEVLARMKRKLKSALKYYEQTHKEFSESMRILRNVDYLKDRFPYPKAMVNKDIKTLTEKFDKFLDFGKVTIIDIDVPIQPIFEKYFNEEPPFHNETKKSEFPDAFALAAMELWCETNVQVAYLLSLDNDMLEYLSAQLIPVGELSELIDLINRSVKEMKRLKNIETADAVFRQEIMTLMRDLTNKLQDSLEEAANEIENHPTYEVESIDNVAVKNVQINHHSIIHIDDREAQIEMNVSFDFEVDFEAISYDSAFYDREDGRWYNEERVDEKIRDRITVEVEATIIHSSPQGILGGKVEIGTINNGQGIDLSEYL